MRPIKHAPSAALIAVCMATASALHAIAGVPVTWTVDAFKARVQPLEAFHGETLDMSVPITAYGEPVDLAGKTATLYWQTPGMGDEWYSANASVKVDAESGATNVLAATWNGKYDQGSASVTGFIGVQGEIYRAAFTVAFKSSPGFDPSEIPLPVRTLDFASTAVANPEAAPFVVKGGSGGVDAAAVTNIAAGVAGGVVTNAVAPWAMADKSAPVTDLTPATNYTDAVAATKRDLTNMVVSAESFGPWSGFGIDYKTTLSFISGYGYFYNIYNGSDTLLGSLSKTKEEGWDSSEDAECATEGYVWWNTTLQYEAVTRAHTNAVNLATTADIAAATNACAPSATNPAFSNAVLSVGLGIDTNSVAVLNAIAADFGGFPLSSGETASTVGGLLLALAAAVAWLKKNKLTAGLGSDGKPTDANVAALFTNKVSSEPKQITQLLNNSVLEKSVDLVCEAKAPYNYSAATSFPTTAADCTTYRNKTALTDSQSVTITAPLPTDSSKQMSEFILRFTVGTSAEEEMTAPTITINPPDGAKFTKLSISGDDIEISATDKYEYEAFYQVLPLGEDTSTDPATPTYELIGTIRKLS